MSVTSERYAQNRLDQWLAGENERAEAKAELIRASLAGRAGYAEMEADPDYKRLTEEWDSLNEHDRARLPGAVILSSLYEMMWHYDLFDTDASTSTERASAPAPTPPIRRRKTGGRPSVSNPAEDRKVAELMERHRDREHVARLMHNITGREWTRDMVKLAQDRHRKCVPDAE